MQLSIVFPMFWGRKKKKIYKKNDQFYDHPTALELLRSVGPLAVTSANLSGAENSCTAKQVLQQLNQL